MAHFCCWLSQQVSVRPALGIVGLRVSSVIHLFSACMFRVHAFVLYFTITSW